MAAKEGILERNRGESRTREQRSKRKNIVETGEKAGTWDRAAKEGIKEKQGKQQLERNRRQKIYKKTAAA